MDTPYRPQITHARRPRTFTVDARNERGEVLATEIAGEHPLTLYVDKREIVTLMTLGSAPEALAIGYLRNQRLRFVPGLRNEISLDGCSTTRDSLDGHPIPPVRVERRDFQKL